MQLIKLWYAGGSLACAAIGVWMLFDPVSWYTSFPGGISDTGPFNAHFIQDIGVAITVISFTFAWCAFHLTRARPAHLILTAYFVGHAVLHAADLVVGHLPAVHWWMDTPSVFLPAILMLLLALPPVWRLAVSRRPSPNQTSTITSVP